MLDQMILVSAYHAVKMFATEPSAHLDDLDQTKVTFMNKALNRSDSDKPGFSMLETNKSSAKSKTDLKAYFLTGGLKEDHVVWTNPNQFTKPEFLISAIGKTKPIYFKLGPQKTPPPKKRKLDEAVRRRNVDGKSSFFYHYGFKT